MLISVIYHGILTILTAIYHEKPMNKRGLYHRNRRYDVIPIRRKPFYRDIFLPLPCKQLVQAFYKVSGVFERTAFQQQRLI